MDSDIKIKFFDGTLKKCSMCQVTKTTDEFHVSYYGKKAGVLNRSNHWYSRCKICHSVANANSRDKKKNSTR